MAAIKVSALTQRVFPIVTDEEKGIVNAIRKFLPNSIRLHCWNHIFRISHLQIFISDINDLFHKPSHDAYEAELKQRIANWINPILQYYLKNIHPVIHTPISQWKVYIVPSVEYLRISLKALTWS